ncbi:receptor-activated Ca2+-permeable cation channel [Sporothrix brasiliensis 5110]|uniref:Receptor-activated Ca2+-permeable cation channel n=1 Tax=Sporothrix brasiliensis 5110 TaxID=1398154 RepID=A0A0C2IHZ8_9PEZI|nr:receptor-activated Ca2+-permeable cation channel [Sporothrix brasiliensis 5110]KIH88811.1 receptor-activated Ca2+-permeable cation channel [Sporothrix brasiliensis 5110]
MPIRVKSRPLPLPLADADSGLRSPSPFLGDGLRSGGRLPDDMPDIGLEDSFRVVIKKLSLYIADAVVLPCTFEQLRTTSAGDRLRTLVTHLSITCDNPAIVNALLALKWHYGAAGGDRSLCEARANACEIVAWRFLTHLSEREAVDFCLYEIPGTSKAPCGVAAASAAAIGGQAPSGNGDEEVGSHGSLPRVSGAIDESSPLLSRIWTSATSDPDRAAKRRSRPRAGNQRYQLLQSISRLTMSMHHDHRDRSDSDCDSEDGEDGEHRHHHGGDGDDCDDDEEDPTAPFVNLNALEIAAVADAKRFLSQNVVQKIITGIWNGDIVFWDRLEVDAVKKPRFYNSHTADPFARLRVPKYLKIFEAMCFLAFLAIFYLTLLERNPFKVGPAEVLFYFFLAAFAYDELSEWIDAGSLFYVYDFWNVFDLIMICIGFLFVVLRTIGLSRNSEYLIDLSFDILSLEALFMVPRISSILSLSPYWGTLIPCFKEMTKDFVKFMVLVVIIYLGFLTTFSLLGRALFTLPHMTMVLTKIFFGSSYVGFDIMDDIDPVFGPPLMLVFVTLSSILLMGSLTGMLSNSFSRVMGHAREEYLYVYSIYVLEASTSNRLTHFYPPFNLIALIIFRPLRLFLPSDHKFRAARIALLKVTHLPIVGTIQLYELVRGKIQDASDEYSAIHGPPGRQQTPAYFGTSTHQGGGSGAASGRIDARSSSVTAGALVTPKKTLVRPPLGQRPSSSSFRHQQQRQQDIGSPARPLSTSEYAPHLAQSCEGLVTAGAAAATADEDTAIDVPTDVEVRIAELSSKIDKLTELVLQMQMAQNNSAK